MKSLDNLREYVTKQAHINEVVKSCVVAYIDGIEREVAGMVPLPVDADGVPIHVGDVMENIVCPSVHREVTGVGVECFYGWDDGNGRYSQFDVNCYRHHHAPTVEDVLREMLDALDVDVCLDPDKTIAEYAAKLRLAEGVDE